MALRFARKDTNFTGKILTVSMLKSILSAGMFEKLPGTFCYHDYVVLSTASVGFHFQLGSGRDWVVITHYCVLDSGFADVDSASCSSEPELSAGLS